VSELVSLYGVVVLITGTLALLAIWSPRRLGVKVAAVATSALALPAAYAGLATLMSLPKPAGLEWWHREAPAADVLGTSLREDQGIYLWLQLPEADAPRAYVLPWDRALAEQLQAALREAEDRGGEVQMRHPFESSLDDREPKFYAAPPAALPLKDAPGPPPLRLSRE
jgi:hypothetical protein